MPTYGEYELQVSKYYPIAYWNISSYSSGSSETSLYGSSAVLQKTSTTDGYKPIIYSGNSGTNILFQGNTTSVSSSEFNKINICKSSYNTQQFTINFWYKNLNNTIDQSTPILKIGSSGDYRINLYTKNGKFILDFLGQKTYVEVSDYRDIFNISIVYDGINSNLLVNGIAGKTLTIKNATFSVSPELIFQSGTNCIVQYSNLSIYGYVLSQTQINNLYRIGSRKTETLNQIYRMIDASTFSYQIPEVYKTIDYSPGNDIQTRNCYYVNNNIYLKSKSVAVINGATFDTNKYTFVDSNNIYVEILDDDVDRNNVLFKVTSPDLDISYGTIMYIDCNQPISVILNGGYVEVYSTTSIAPIFTSSVTTQQYIAIQMIDGEIHIDFGGTVTNTKIASPLSFKSVTLGNNGSGTNSMNTIDAGLSSTSSWISSLDGGQANTVFTSNLDANSYSGGITGFEINYVNQPLQIGIYNLDLTQSYTSYIKPKQDGVAVFNFIADTSTTLNYITYESSGGVSVQKFTSINTLDEYYSCSNGSSLVDGDIVFTSPLVSTDLVLIAARVYDDSTGSSHADINFPLIKSLKILGYSDYKVYSNNSPIQTSFGSTHPYNPTTKYRNGIYIKSNSNITFSGSSIQASSMFFYMKPESLPNTSTIVEYNGTTLTLTKTNATTYTLSVDNGATLYVNGTSYASGVQSVNLYVYDEIYVLISLPSLSNITPYFSNCSSILVREIGFSNISGSKFNYAVSRLHKAEFIEYIYDISDADIINLSDSISVNAFTSNIVFSG